MRLLFAERVRAVILGTAALACTACSTAPAVVEEPFEIVYQNDGIRWMAPTTTYSYPRWQELKGLKAERFHREVDKYADCGVRSISFGNWSVSNSMNRPTKVGTPLGGGIPDEKITHKIHLQLKHDLADYLARGIDPLREVIDHAHRRGITITVEFRMNNAAPSGPLEGTPSPAGPCYNGLLWYQKPEWRLTDPYIDPNSTTPNPNWDYAKPQVRDFYLQVVKEVLDNYDNIAGIDLSFYQNPPFFNLAEPNKAQHMTDFVTAVRRECDLAGERLGRRLMLTVLMWDNLYGRDALEDDGLDPATWSKAGLIDRLVVVTHVDPFGGTNPLCDIKPYLEMVKGTGCKIYAACELRKHDVFKQIEDTYRPLGIDGVFYLNCDASPGAVGEYRSPNVSYRCDAEPAKAPNAWEQSESGGMAMAGGVAELGGDVTLWRDAAILFTGGPGVTMEATLRTINPPTTGVCGFRVATGERTAALGVARNGLVLLDGDTRIATIDLDTTATHTIRLTIDRTHEAKVYVDNRPVPAATATLVKPTVGERITWGHVDESAFSAARSRWRAVHYTLEGAFSPTQRTFR